MDEQKESQDLTVGMDGKMTEGATTEAPESESATTNDILPPPEATPSNTDGEAIEVKTTAPAAAEDTSTEQLGSPVEAPADTVPEDSKSSPDTLSADAESESSPTAPQPGASFNSEAQPSMTSAETTASTTTTQAMPPHEHRNNKRLIVSVTILVALLLAAAAVFVYMSAQNNTAEGEPTIESMEQTEPVTSDEIEEAVGEVQEALDSFDDTQDFNEEQLSDETLGL